MPPAPSSLTKPRDPAGLPPGLNWRGTILHIDTVVDGGRHCFSTRTADVRRAREMLDGLRTRAVNERIAGHGAPDPAGRTWDTFLVHALERLASEGLAVRTIAKLQACGRLFSRFLRARHLAHLTLRELTRAHVEDYRSWALATPRTRNGHATGNARPPAIRTVCNELDMLRILMRRAVRWDLLRDSPERFVARIRGAYEPRTRWLSDEEIGLILAACAGLRTRGLHRSDLLARALFTLLLNTGLRLGELQHLRLHDVRTMPDGRKVLRIGPFEQQCSLVILRRRGEAAQPPEAILKQALRGVWGARVIAASDHPSVPDAVIGHAELRFKPKSGRERLVPLNSHALEALAQLAAWRDLDEQQHPIAQLRRELGFPPPVWLLPEPGGAPHRLRPLRLLHAACDAANVPRCRVHDWRHTFATRLRANGVPLESVKELLGHANIEETMRYAHYGIQEGFTAVDRLGGIAAPPAQVG